MSGVGRRVVDGGSTRTQVSGGWIENETHTKEKRKGEKRREENS